MPNTDEHREEVRVDQFTADEDANFDADPLRQIDLRLRVRRSNSFKKPNKNVADALISAFRSAKSHRDAIGVSEAIQRQTRQHQGVHEPEDHVENVEAGVDLFAPISSVKFAQGYTKLREVLGDSANFPFGLDPSPTPEIPQSKRATMRQRLLQLLIQNGAGFDRQSLPEALRTARVVRAEMEREIRNEARLATEGMERKLRDRLYNAELLDALDEMAQYIFIYKTAFLNRENQVRVPAPRWNGDSFEIGYQTRDRISAPHPGDVYPMSDCSSPQDGTGYFLVKWVSYTDVMQLGNVEGFIDIDKVIKDIDSGELNPDWLTWELQNQALDRERGINRDDTTVEALAGKLYPILCYHGKLDSSKLKDMDVPMAGVPDGLHESECWVLGNRVIMSRLNPHPMGRRPLHGASYNPIPGSFWGLSMYDMIWDSQRQANAVLRELYVHIPTIVVPIMEASIDRWGLSSKPSRFKPGQVFYTYDEENSGGRPAIQLHNHSSHVNELLGLLENIYRDADERSGIPRYAYGNNSAGAARSAAGLTTMLQNQSALMRELIKRIGAQVVREIVRDLYLDEMVNGEDQSIKCDAEPVIRGLEALLQREEQESRAAEDLQITTGVAQVLGPAATPMIHFMYRSLLKARGHDPAEIDTFIPDPVRLIQLQQALAAQQGGNPAGPGGTPGGVPAAPPGLNSPPTGEAQLDGRSAQALANLG